MDLSRRSFLKTMGIGAAGTGLGMNTSASSLDSLQGHSEKFLVKDPDHPKAASKGTERLPLSWYKKTAKRLREKVGELGVDVVVLADSWNLTYFSGCFLTKTERPCWCVFPVNNDAIYWWSPGLDNELVKSWWCTEMNYYYDYPHTIGGYFDQGKVVFPNNRISLSI